mgnify:CR=1 FL=1
MKKILKLGIFIFLAIIFILLIREKQTNNLLQKEIINLRSAPQISPKEYPETIDDFIKKGNNYYFTKGIPKDIEEITKVNNQKEMKKLDNYPYALKLTETGYFNVFDAFLADLKNNGSKNPVLHLAPAGCGSCHARNILVLEGANIIFKTSGDNLAVSVKNIKMPFHDDYSVNALIVQSATYGLGEPSGCHEWYLETAYYWSTDQFFTLYEKPIHRDECNYKPASK